jgi:hypothetical protein
MNIKDEIKKLEEKAKPNYQNMSCSKQDTAIETAQVAIDALKIIDKLQEVVEMQQKCLQEISDNYANPVQAPVNAMLALEEMKQILGE